MDVSIHCLAKIRFATSIVNTHCGRIFCDFSFDNELLQFQENTFSDITFKEIILNHNDRRLQILI